MSIGMPLYNAERYLAGTLDDILAQTIGDFELVISDNASTDRTPSICARYAARDPRIRYSRNAANMGAAYNYRRVFALSRAPYFKFAAYDDRLAPTYLAALVEVLDREPDVVLAYPRCIVIDAEGAPLANAPLPTHLSLRQRTPHERLQAFIPSVRPRRMYDPVFGLVRSATLRRTAVHGDYISADAILLGEIALHGQIAEVPAVLFFERYHAAGSVLANPTLDDRFAWFDPAARGRLVNRLFVWRWTYELLSAIDRANLSRSERWRCRAAVRHFVWQQRGGLARNLFSAAKFIALRRAVARP